MHLSHFLAFLHVANFNKVSFDPSRGTDSKGGLIPFGQNKTVANAEIAAMARGDKPECHLFYICFDIIHVSGRGASEALAKAYPGQVAPDGDVSHWPLFARRRLLRTILSEEPHRLEFVKGRECPEGSKEMRCKFIDDFFAAANDRGEEGLVVKDLSSPYICGEKSRHASHWVKMKPEYSDQVDALDVLVVGAYYGDGTRRAGLLSHFLLAVSDHTTLKEDGSEPGDVNLTKWFTLGKVGTGYSVPELQTFNEKIKDFVVPFTAPGGRSRQGSDWPKWLHNWNMKKDDIPDVFIAPDKSFVMEIKVAELVKTDQFSAERTPRFPRCENIRYDKSWWSAMSQKELIELSRQGLRLGGDGAVDEFGGSSGSGIAASSRRAQRRMGQKATKVIKDQILDKSTILLKEEVLKEFCPDGKLLSNIFCDLTFSVLTFSDSKRVPHAPGAQLPWTPLVRAAEARVSQSSGFSHRFGNQVVSESDVGGAAKPSQYSQALDAGSADDILGLDTEAANEVKFKYKERCKKYSVADIQKILYCNGAHMVVGSSVHSGQTSAEESFQVDFTLVLDPEHPTQALENILRRRRALGVARQAASLKGPGKGAAAAAAAAALELQPIEMVDIMSVAWALDCAILGELLPLNYEYMVDLSPDTWEIMRAHVDEFGDRFCEDANPESLCRALAEVGKKRPSELPWSTAHDVEAASHKGLGLRRSPASAEVVTPPAKSRALASLGVVLPRRKLSPPPASVQPLQGSKDTSRFKRPRNGPSVGPDWRDVVGLWNLEDQEAVETPFTAFWRKEQFCVYLDRYSTLGQLEPPAPTSWRSKNSVTSYENPSAARALGEARSKEMTARSTELLPFSSLTPSFYRIKMLSGEVACSLHCGVTHVVLDPDEPARFDEIRQRLTEIRAHGSARGELRLVTEEWVRACASEGSARAPVHPGEALLPSVLRKKIALPAGS